MMILVLLGIGNIFRGDFGLFYQTVKTSALLQPTTDIIDTYVFRMLINTGDVGMAAAAGLYQSVLCFVTIVVVQRAGAQGAARIRALLSGEAEQMHRRTQAAQAAGS